MLRSLCLPLATLAATLAAGCHAAGCRENDLACAQLTEAGFCGVDFCTAHVIRKTTDQGSREYPLFLAVATRPG